MTQRILVFESDPGFASEVQTNFERLGATVDLLSDGASGVEHATATKPDLILLSIELTGMNGYLLCNKIKKMPALKGIPLVMLSSEASDSGFEAHRKLKTRAEDYIRKPIAFDELLKRVQQFVPIKANGMADAADDDIIVVPEDDDVVMDAAPEAEAFASDAIDAMVVSDEDAAVAELDAALDAPSEPPAAPAEATPPPPPPPPPAPVAAPVAAPAAPPPPAPVMAASEDSQVSSVEVARLKSELGKAQQRAAAAEKMLEDVKSKAAKGTGVSSREFLDLREQLNRKDRELLELRDQVTARDKQLIELNDKSLVLEREIADLRDKALEAERDLDKKNEVVEALTADKEAAKKRADDLKARLERAEAKGKEVSTELDGLKAAHAAEIEKLRTDHATATARNAAEQAGELDGIRSEHASSLATAKAQHESEVLTLKQAVADAQSAGESRAAQLLAEKESLEAQNVRRAAEDQEAKETALAELRALLSAEAAASLAAAEQSNKDGLDKALKAHEAELVTLREQMERAHADQVKELTDKHSKDMALVGRRLSDTESKLAINEERLEESETARADFESKLNATSQERDEKVAALAAAHASIEDLNATKANHEQRLADLERKLSAATARIERDEQLLARVRKALGIGLGLLEEQQNPTDG